MHLADTAPRLPSPYRLRLDAALRTLRLALRRHIRRRWTRPIAFDHGSGAVELVDIREGRIHLRGWTDAPLITAASEIQSRQVVPMLPRADIPDCPAARGFDICLTGTERLTIEAEGALVLSLDPPSALHRGMAAARLLGKLVRVPVLHGRDLAAFALQGDSAAGNRLERVLLPLPPAPPVPTAPHGLFRPATPAPIEPAVDIIVPVHNAADDLRICLDRLARFTPAHHRITVIDDASTDPRVPDILADCAARHPGMRLLRNETNLGFIGTVNRGLAAAQGHVVLVNTDAFVPENWLARLLRPILTDPTIASVTPMSNNGEIASVPLMGRATSLPAGLADRIDRAAAALNPAGALAEMPTGVGFCMALSRAWLARVPQLDPAFGRGYGEEVDWCRKTAALGGRHVLAGTLFVEHRGGSSFGPEKAARLVANNRLISKRYPDYDAAVQAFIDDDPAIGPRLALALAMAGAAGRVCVYLGHRLGGGSEYWLATELGAHMAANRPAVVIRGGDSPGLARVELHRPDGVLTADAPLPDLPHYLALLGEKDIIYSSLVGTDDPLALAAAAVLALDPGDGFNVLLHDFFPLCPSYDLLDATGRYCGLPADGTCQGCYSRLVRLTGTRPPTIDAWRKNWRALLDRADRITVFSRPSRELVLRTWPDLAGKLSIEPHVPPILPRKVIPKPGQRPTVGILGAISRAKGAEVLRDLAARADNLLRIVVIGTMDPTYAHPAIRVHGPYDHADIADLAEHYGIDRWLIPAIWPETFSYATHECIATGLPVFAFDLGAQGEAVARAPNGWVLDRAVSQQRLIEALLSVNPGQEGLAP